MFQYRYVAALLGLYRYYVLAGSRYPAMEMIMHGFLELTIHGGSVPSSRILFRWKLVLMVWSGGGGGGGGR